MNDYARRAIMLLLIIIVVILSISHVKPRKPVVKLVPVQAPIPSAREIQQRLKDLDDPRYDPGKVDGIPGQDTMRGWNNLIKDRYAKRAFEGE